MTELLDFFPNVLFWLFGVIIPGYLTIVAITNETSNSPVRNYVDRLLKPRFVDGTIHLLLLSGIFGLFELFLSFALVTGPPSLRLTAAAVGVYFIIFFAWFYVVVFKIVRIYVFPKIKELPNMTNEPKLIITQIILGIIVVIGLVLGLNIFATSAVGVLFPLLISEPVSVNSELTNGTFVTFISNVHDATVVIYDVKGTCNFTLKSLYTSPKVPIILLAKQSLILESNSINCTAPYYVFLGAPRFQYTCEYFGLYQKCEATYLG